MLNARASPNNAFPTLACAPILRDISSASVNAPSAAPDTRPGVIPVRLFFFLSAWNVSVLALVQPARRRGIQARVTEIQVWIYVLGTPVIGFTRA